MRQVEKYLYKTDYVNDYKKFKESIINKTILPYQVEIQPGPTGAKICWLDCPYCYGKSAINSKERLSLERYLELINEIADGGIKKVIFAGWATDPLFYKNIDELVECSVKNKLIVGFNTKAINVSNNLINSLASSKLNSDSYMSISIDASNNEIYNLVHGVKNLKSNIYERVKNNIKNIKLKSNIFISVSYLVNDHNCDKEIISSFIEQFTELNVDLIRFSFPQFPKGQEIGYTPDIPDEKRRNELEKELRIYINEISKNINTNTKILFLPSNDLFYKPRSLPCFARFIYPTIGYDGWLYHCSQSAGTNFHSTALGNLNEKNFFELLYNYDFSDEKNYFNNLCNKLDKSGCRCDRKEHTVNNAIKASNCFNY